jgi:hypothetical protein
VGSVSGDVSLMLGDGLWAPGSLEYSLVSATLHRMVWKSCGTQQPLAGIPCGEAHGDQHTSVHHWVVAFGAGEQVIQQHKTGAWLLPEGAVVCTWPIFIP